jgi:4'-phosphopantetheinyl transferase EntD
MNCTDTGEQPSALQHHDMIEEILPAAVACAESFGDIVDAYLYPEEEALLSHAVESRRREFSTVRACARTALSNLGLAPAPILPGPLGAPMWPAGVVGSMTHCTAYRASVVARASDMSSIGVDAEANEPLPRDVLNFVADDSERAWVTELLAASPEVSWDRLLFSAKESVFKTWFPLTWRWLDFSQTTITVDPAVGTFSARLMVPAATPGPASTGFAGRWLARDGLLLTAVTVSRTGG